MSSRTQSTGPSLRTATLLAALVGVLLLLYAAACVQIHLDHPTSRFGSTLLILGFSACGALSLTASGLLYRRHSLALPIYCASLALNVIGWVAIALGVQSKPLWYVLSYA